MKYLAFSSLGKGFESVPGMQELHISGTRVSSCFGAMDRSCGIVLLLGKSGSFETT